MIFVFLLVGILFVGLAIPLVRRKVPPNQLYGLRVPATLESEAVWYEANARSGRDLLWLGIGIIVASSVLYVIPWSESGHYLVICVSVVLVGVVGYCLRAFLIVKEVKAELGGVGDVEEGES